MSLNAIITNALADAASQMTTQVLHLAINRLAEKYGFDFAEAIQFINLEPARPEVLKKSDLPWCGVADPTCCAALAFRGGLYTQCHKSHVTDGLCVACHKQKQETGSLKNGTVEDRLAVAPFEFLDGKVARFTKLMAKNAWTQELVERSAAEYGLTIPPENFIESKPKRGRKVTRPVMETPEPQAITETVVEPVAVAEESESEVAPTPVAQFVTYSATEPDSDEELQEEAPKVEKPKKEKKVKPEGEKPKKEKAEKPEGENPKKEKAEKTEGEKPKKKKAEKAEEPADSGSESEKPKKKAGKAAAEEPTDSGSESEKTKKKDEETSGSDSEPKKKAVVDYMNITAEQAALLKPMALRTACAQHDIVIGSKTAETLRAELITKVSA